VTNPPPVIGDVVVPDTPVNVGQEVFIDVGAVTNDPDNDQNLTYSSDDLPEGLMIDPDTGVITGAPTIPQNGPYSFTVKVDDGDGGVTEVVITLGVVDDAFTDQTDPGAPNGPTISSRDGDSGDAFDFQDDKDSDDGGRNGDTLDLERYFAERALNAQDDLGRTFGDKDFWGGMVAAKLPGMGSDCAYLVVEAVSNEHNVNVTFGSTLADFCDVNVRNWDVNMVNGASLPAWVDWSRGGDFMEIARPIDAETIQMRVRATLDNGRSATITVEVDLRTGAVTQIGDAYAQAQTLQEQLAMEAQDMREQLATADTAQDALLRALAG